MLNYKNYEKLVKKISWSWHKTTGIDLETLIAEANVAFVECQNDYDFQQGKFSTLLWTAIENKFKNLIAYKRQGRHNGIEVELENLALSNLSTQEKRCIFQDALIKLSQEAQQITSIVLEAPADLLAMLQKPRLSKHQLTKHLRLKGWKIPAINKAYVEIKNNLNF
jgi:hypothetical protein